MYKKKRAYIFVVIAAVLWGTIGVYSKYLSAAGFTVLQLVSVRAFFSVLAIFLYLVVKDRSLLKVKFCDFPYFIGTGIVSFVFFNWCYFVAINKTSLSIAVILLYTAPAFVMAISAFLFKEQMTRRKIMALCLTFAGCVFVTAFVKGTSQVISVSGIMAGLGSGLGYALYSIFGRYALKKYHPYTVTLYTFAFASAFLLPTSNIRGTIGLLNNQSAWVNAVLLSVVATVLPFLLYTKGLSQMETGKASVIATLEPVVATIIGIALFHEPVSVFKLIGILLVISAVSILDGVGTEDMGSAEEAETEQFD